MESLRSLFTQNRSEEIGEDVYTHFVVPPFYADLDLLQARKPRVIYGGRGCGKTMLLLYLAHRSTFSRDRQAISPTAIQHIGLYWRADTQFAKTMNGRGITAEVWHNAFEHLLALSIGLEVLESLYSVAHSACPALEPDALGALTLDELSGYDVDLSGSVHNCRVVLRRKLAEFETWVSNAEREAPPRFLPGTRFLAGLIRSIRAKATGMEQASFFVYVDEYENLHVEQQKIINTHLKHSAVPLVFNIAAKRNGITTKQTTGTEQLQDIADFRTHDIEKYLEPHFPLFAAEVLCLTLALGGYEVPVSPDALRDPGALLSRQGAEYRSSVLEYTRRLLPGRTHRELAEGVLADGALLRVLRERIDKALKSKRSSLSADQFIVKEHPQASIVCSVLLYRRSVKPEEVLGELEKLGSSTTSRFSTSDWTKNNFVGALLALYGPFSKTSDFYAGFDTFCHLSKTNLRHFRELCHRAWNRSWPVNSAAAQLEPVPVRAQAEGARDASEAFLEQIKTAGRLGNRLYAFVMRLGLLFEAAHRRPTQSEPEIRHFVIKNGDTSPFEDFLNEATKWSLLFEEDETKIKTGASSARSEYVLNPIYAPAFMISYRKGRKLEISAEDFRVLSEGPSDRFEELLRRYRREWQVDSLDTPPSLFNPPAAES